jgi:hypothetical protein
MTRRSGGSEVTGMRSRATIATVIAALATALLAVLTFAGPTLADPPDTLISPPNHRHFIVTPDGLVPVGPQICGNPEMQQAFNEFHYNIHHSVVPGIGDVPTLGPQDGAPGLHNGRGAEVIGVPGCG